MTRHAVERCQQRGIQGNTLTELFKVADRIVPVGDGREAVSLSRSAARKLRETGYPAAMLERLDATTAVIAPCGMVITVIHASAGHYRRK